MALNILNFPSNGFQRQHHVTTQIKSKLTASPSSFRIIHIPFEIFPIIRCRKNLTLCHQKKEKNMTQKAGTASSCRTINRRQKQQQKKSIPKFYDREKALENI